METSIFRGKPQLSLMLLLLGIYIDILVEGKVSSPLLPFIRLSNPCCLHSVESH